MSKDEIEKKITIKIMMTKFCIKTKWKIIIRGYIEK
jgi:hypothetical protein